MKNTIDLYHFNGSSPRGSEKYNILKFPDNEVQIEFAEDISKKLDLNIIAPIRSSEELFLLLQVLKLTKGSNQRRVSIPYLMSARNDRSFGNRAVNTEIVDEMISMYLNKGDVVLFVDPHSPFKNYEHILRKGAQIEVWKPLPKEADVANNFVIYPDTGAARRYSKIIHTNRYAVAEKERDFKTGWINKYHIDIEGLKPTDTIYIIDDLVDGGSTFKMLAEELKGLPNRKELIVTHYIQREPLLRLTLHYDHIWVTNSYEPGFTNEKVTVGDVRR